MGNRVLRFRPLRTPCPTMPVAPRKITFTCDRPSTQATASNFTRTAAQQFRDLIPAAAAVPTFLLRSK
jgi:hypothetical protein